MTCGVVSANIAMTKISDALSLAQLQCGITFTPARMLEQNVLNAGG
jgi:hypothetical protein